MIKGIILDVDGVIVGSRKGYNYLLPHTDVIAALKHLRQRGIMVSLCTGKGTFAIKEIVEAAHLNNLHIGDGGAVVMDFLNNVVIDKHVIAKDVIESILPVLQARGTYIELYTLDGYFVQRNAVGEITKQHGAILGRAPFIVNSLNDVVKNSDIVKIMPVAKDDKDKQEIISTLKDFQDSFPLQWGVHPTALPYQFGIITANGISKKQAVQAISEYTKISLENMLGIGDGMTDWQFMEICGYAGAMGNGSQELKDKIVTKGERGFIGGSVDENGVLDILKHFKVV